METVHAQFIELWRTNFIAHNTGVIKEVEERIHSKQYILHNGRLVTIDSDKYSILMRYIRYTELQTSKFLSIVVDADADIETYRIASIRHKSPRLFINGVFNSAALGLFSEKDADILMRYTDRSITGGGSIQLPPLTFAYPEDDYTVDREYDDTDMPAVKTKHTLYLLLSEKYPKLPSPEKSYIVEGISSMLYIYFGYIGESSYDPKFLTNIFQDYESRTLGQMSMSDFERLYRTYHPVEIEQSAEESIHIQPVRTPQTISVYGAVYGGKRRTTRRHKRKSYA